MADPDLLDLEHFLPYRLSVLSNRISQDIARLYADRFGLGITEWRVLAVLGRHPGISAREVAERTAMDKVAVSRAVASLLAAGRITRDTASGARDSLHSAVQLSVELDTIVGSVGSIDIHANAITSF